KNKDEIQSRLVSLENQALASSRLDLSSQSLSNYQVWLRGLAASADLRVTQVSVPAAAGTTKGIYNRHAFSIKVEGRLDQIAEFVRRFHNTKYLHMIQSFGLTPVANQPGMFGVQFKVEVLSLPQVDFVNVPDMKELPPITSDEEQMLKIIRERAILSEYTPPVVPGPAPPPRAPCNDVIFCYLTAVVEADGKPQCWIDHRAIGIKYYLFEEESFVLAEQRCIIKKIEVENQQIILDIGGDLFSLKVGKQFEDLEAEE
ncbi:MAG: hypothetical protein LBI05_03375, partial [Planctomycetaceae bacterium]|nr:hypothetical protein [Planctomycetaceae bacterium]